jgi:hypothetical protein
MAPVETRVYSGVTTMTPTGEPWYELYQNEEGGVSLLPVVAWGLSGPPEDQRTVGIRAPLVQPPEGFAFQGYVRGRDRAPVLEEKPKTWQGIYEDIMDLRCQERLKVEQGGESA